MIYKNKAEAQGRISEAQARITAYNTFVELLNIKLEKVKADEPVTFKPEAPVSETSTKQEKQVYLEEAIKNNQDGIILEQAAIADCQAQMPNLPED